MKKLFTLFTALLLLAVSSWATTVTIGTGTSTGRYPLDDYFVHSRSQMLFLASEITTGGTISHLRWYRDDVGADPNAIGITEIWLMETTATILSGTAWEGPGTLVATLSNLDLGLGGGWYEIDINDFAYSGTANLLVSVRTQNAPDLAPHSYWRYTSTTTNYRMRAGNSDSQNPPTMTLSYNRPNIQIEFLVAGPPGCANIVSPPDLAANVFPSATLNWSAGSGGTPTGYKLFFGTDLPPTNIVNGTNIGLVTTYDPNPDMGYSTTYHWKIVPTNSFGDATDCPVWSFTTGFPLCENFDGTAFPPSGWITVKTAGTGTPGTWNRVASGTNPACATHSGNGMARYNCYSLAAGTAGILVTPPVNFPSDFYRVEFWMYRDDGYPALADLVNVYYNTAPGLSGATLLGTINRARGLSPPEVSNGWYQYYFDMPTGSGGGGRYVIFEAVSQFGNNIFIDDVCLVVQPPCPVPANLTATNITTISADLGWTSTGSTWDVEYGQVPYTFTGTPSFTTNNNPHLLVGLNPGTSYIYKVRNDCGSGLYSFWSTPCTFTTLCNSVVDIPYYQNFDGVVPPAIPPCMTVTNDNGDTKLWLTTVSNPRSTPNAVSIGYNSTLAMDDWFFPPGLNLVAGVTYNVKFWYKAGSSSFIEKLRVMWGTAPNAAGMTGGIIWDNSNITNTTYAEGTGIIMPSVSGVYYIGWQGYSDPDQLTLFVDDISITGGALINPGTDPFTVTEGVISFGSGKTGNDYPPLPADFFGPGSQPFEGQIYLQGRNSNGGEEWNNDVLVNRPTTGILYEPPSVTIMPAEMTQLVLESTAPILVTRPGPGGYQIDSFFDVFLEMSPVPPPFPGSMEIMLENPEGGVCSSTLPVHPVFTFINMDDPSEIYTYDPGAEGMDPLMYHSMGSPWTLSPKPGQFDYSPETTVTMTTMAGTSLTLSPVLSRMGETFDVTVNEYGEVEDYMGNGYDHGRWFWYPRTLWWNVWWYDHPIRTNRTKYVLSPVIWLYPRLIGYPSSGEIVYTWSTPQWPTWTSISRPPLAQDFSSLAAEDAVIRRSPPLYQWNGPLYEQYQIPLTYPYLIPYYYNPEWFSIDIRGYNYRLTGWLNHICWRQPTRSVDFGDAPAPFPTLLASNGARHTIVAGVFMGIRVDAEADGQPNATATGDDINPLMFDDEDGVIFNTPLNPGQAATLTVTCSIGNALLQGWIDFNRNGSWLDPGEQIMINRVTVAGANLINYNVPASATPGTTFARIRMSTMPNLTIYGEAPNGEVEDYQVQIEEPQLDWGDAPDQPYPTLLVTNGARHIINPAIFMGVLIDAEPNGQPNASATGDDINPAGANDEDGVVFNTPLNPGQAATVTITTSLAGAFLQGWIDFNANGSWADAGEQIITNLLTIAGNNVVIFNVPAGATAGQTFARFRYSTMQGITFTGQAPNGEVEDYQVQIEQLLDWGDAPDLPYPTLLGTNGARHTIVPGMFMGVTIDGESDGQPNGTATGDDINPATSDDEDGVVFNTLLNPGQTATVTITTSAAGAYLQGWIDFNANGSWADAGDQFIINLPTIAGNNVVNFNVPAGAMPGITYARFRYSNVQGLPFEGAAPNGEVEDYQVHIEQLQPFDYGDAPDPTYPTLLASNGARHINTGLRLGNQIDVELNGQPSPNADGDDLNPPTGFDDEDGVWWPCSFVPGHKTTIQVTASGPGLLNAWFDFNRNGSWANAGEQIFTNTALAAGVNYLSFTVPANAGLGSTYARFRFSTQPNLTFTGAANDGEVEDYRFVIEPAVPMDYGDAPDLPYPTLALSDGARHAQGPPAGVFMGNLVDYELNGQPNVFASGDVPDEDGVVFNTPLIPGGPATITITVSMTGPLLQGWIDFNANGSFADAGEQVLLNVNPGALIQPYIINVPAGAVVGKTYARFRFSTMPNLSWYGCVGNGEVEDYMVYIGEYDLGDAPDPNYPTLLASNGAIHKITPLFMGGLIDAEPNGQPNASATGDDINPQGSNDEDGVWWPCNFMPGAVNTVKVTTTGGGYLNAWFDYNMNGSWADPGDQVFTNVALLPGTTELFVNVPANVTSGNTFARFRFSSQQNLSYSGYAPDGEVEDYGIILQAEDTLDYGDAPDPTYPTLASSNGARHNFIQGVPIFLGNLVDWESNGQPTILADGDDLNNLADEEGVVFLTPLVPGSPATIRVTASIGGGALQGWVDFNANGSWADVGEQIFVNTALIGGPQLLNFNVPGTAISANTYARFRYSTMGNLSYYGCAPNGEVEDYMVHIGVLDYGDAPDPTYPTLFVNNGARHLVDGITFLGSLIDAEPNGLPSATANGDDATNLDDEDGVTFLWPLAANNPCKIKVNASVGNALLNLWIDFNRNGSWADPGEQVFTDLNPVAGDNYLTFIAPANLVPGPSMARVRFSHQPALSFTGYAFDGEVEDYTVDISEYGGIKWLQSFDTRLPGLHASQTAIIGDDWICGGGQVTDIHWWGNYETGSQGEEERGQGINYFLINIYSNGNCLPAQVLQTYNVPFSSILEVNTGYQNSEQGFIYYYEFALPQPFMQIQGMKYWVSIQAISNNPTPPFDAVWRWQEANRWFYPISCGAASSTPTAPWMTIIWPFPEPGQYSDMAFVITSQVQDIEFGDAPDPGYPTLLASDGARHNNLGANIRMGALKDFELNGLPNATATGDDLNNFADEDGVIFNTPLVQGQNATVTVVSNFQNALLQGWIDFNANGSWIDAGEQVATNLITVVGGNTFQFAVPLNATVGNTFARFRLSTVPNLTCTGLASNGEVEDYSITIAPAPLPDMDYGDAPDPTYPTLLASNGASHFNTGLRLGVLIDVEPDGQPNPTATGDDSNNLADEDGVSWPCNFVPGQTVTLQVTASASGFLNAWFDFNANGSWADPGEQIFTNTPLIPGVNNLPVTVPSGAAYGNTYARFRFSTQPNLTFTGTAQDGEVEDYMMVIEEPLPMDYGDVPDPTYPTLAISDGARHAQSPSAGMFLGNLVDYELDGQPDPLALGDDNNPIVSDDEDGIVFSTPLIPNQLATISVTASIGGGAFQGWIDFNANGNWNDPFEQIFTNVSLVTGTQLLSFNVPANAIIGHTYARFRYSTMGNLSFSGYAPDGEVEDYQVLITEQGPVYAEFGDAPEGVTAYPATGIIGLFPTCKTVGPAAWIQHSTSNAFLGFLVDTETDGNAGLCPVFLPSSYDMDECFQDGDAGLLTPAAYTITGVSGSPTVVPCNAANTKALGIVCTQGLWGNNIDVLVQNQMGPGAPVFVNVLFDWDMNGQWGGISVCSTGGVAPEHVLVNFPVPFPFAGPLSALTPPQFIIGPNAGYVWARVSITNVPVPTDWDGAGMFEDGETEDYLIRVCPEILYDLNIQNLVIHTGEHQCFNAYHTITTTNVVVQSGGVMDLIAGNNIRMLPGTWGQPGSYVHGHISMTNFCCWSYLGDRGNDYLETGQDAIQGVTMAKGSFKVYPNPTTGTLTLELSDGLMSASTMVEIYGMMGNKILREKFTGQKKHEISLELQMPGVYILRVITGNEAGTVKVIKQ